MFLFDSVNGRMEATYVNTGHPDFLSGHKAMAVVNEKHSANKPVQVDPKTGKPLPQALQKDTANPQNLDNMTGNDQGGFFGSFFAAKNKKKLAAMEAPPSVLKASGTLSERETIETEVISISLCRLVSLRITDFFLLQYCQENYDRYGSKSNHAQSRRPCKGGSTTRIARKLIPHQRSRRSPQRKRGILFQVFD